MRIGILTFFRNPNYGAMLQAYALWQYLEQRGHEVEFIDYAFDNTRRIALWKCFVSRCLPRYFGIVRRKLKAYVRFDITHFSDTFPRTRRVTTFLGLTELGKKYGAIIVGSDQMWNPMWCSVDLLPVVMLDFVQRGAKRIAYAVSFGTKEWNVDQNAGEAGRLLREFDMISVRENSGTKLVRKLSGRGDAVWLIDPTLLHSAKFYEQLFSRECCKRRSYVFSYMLDEWMEDENVESVLRLVMDVMGIAEVHTDRVSVKGLLAPICRILSVQSKVSVSTWLSEIASSDFVVTNSFHGTVFAILFHKPFLTIPVSGKMSGMNERVVSLLTMVGLESRIVSLNNKCGCKNAINAVVKWDEVDTKLNSERMKASSFLDIVH